VYPCPSENPNDIDKPERWNEEQLGQDCWFYTMVGQRVTMTTHDYQSVNLNISLSKVSLRDLFIMNWFFIYCKII